MLELKSILLRNYLSFGDYETILQLDNLGACLITGEVVDTSDEVSPNKLSNGVGKSSLTEAILWCLFGRTTRVERPGDKVINFFTQKNCIVELKFKNGDMLRRTRNVDGHDDLLLIKDGESIHHNGALGTTTMEQRRINQLLNLDWDLFCGSTFFSQFGQSWMEISDVKRKEALEREFHMDKIQHYADAAKEKLDSSKAEQERLLASITNTQSTLDTYNAQIEQFTKASTTFDAQKRERLKQAADVFNGLVAQRDAVKLIDKNSVSQQWAAYKMSCDGLSKKQDAIYALERDKRNIDTDIARQEGLIRKWKGKGAVCSECEQPIPAEHINSKITTPQQKLADLKSNLASIAAQIKSQQAELAKSKIDIESKKPTLTVEQVESDRRRWQGLDAHVQSQKSTMDKIGAEQNHYDDTLADLGVKVSGCKTEISAISKKVSKLDRLILHLSYIHRAYHDRRKIKSYMLSEYIPYLNERIKYYSKRFELDLSIEFTSALGVKSNYWGYQFFSGGECKRFDVAMMMAMFDLHTLMYGRRSNIVVFDEVDGRLDPRGAELFADILRTDFTSKVDSILVISQRIDMRGSLPSEIKIVREDRFSRIAEVLK